MYRFIAAIAAPILLVGLLVQSIRADGFLWWDGLSDKLAACEAVNAKANERAREAADAAREQGRIAAEAAALDLIAKEQARREQTDKTIADLRALVGKLRPISPPPIVVPGEPILITPSMVTTSCDFKQEPLDAMRNAINASRGQR